jgi:dipeptidyl-peptidase 4
MLKIYRFLLFWGLFIITLPACSQIQYKEITLDAIYRDQVFSVRNVSGIRSMNDGVYYTVSYRGREIQKFSYKTGSKVETLFSMNESTNPILQSFSAYEFSGDESKILLTTGRERIYRHSFRADYYIFHRDQKTLQPLSEKGKQQLATFSPDGTKIAFVRENNLYYKDLVSGKEVQVTFDGKWNEIINGAPDWVYEEEFGFSKAFAWSPDSRKIAFYRFDETRVRLFNMTMYGELYPEWYSFKYPKAGEENSLVTIHVFDLSNGSTRAMDIGEETDQYIPRIKWTAEPDKLAILRLNRLQNHIEVLIANPETGKSNVLYSEKNKWYISETSDDFITFLDDKKHFIVMSERDGWMHFYLYDMKGKLVNQITKGDWDVSELLAYDQKSRTLYYRSYEENPLEMHVYGIQINGKNKKKLSTRQGTNSISFSSNYSYFINTHSTANSPTHVSLHDSKGNLIRVLEDNSALRQTMKTYNFSEVEFTSFTTSDETELFAYMIKPPDFDPGGKYPLLMYVYGGPESQSVRDAWGRHFPWFQMLAQNGYIVACVDNRGTNGRGEAFRKATYMQLGKYETMDQIEGAIHFGSLPFIDAGRIGIYGWSYGGYMAALCMTKGAHVFKAGIAGAPVTNWRFYDTVYTERFMRTPQENPDGYDDNSPINHVEKMKGAFLLIHGTADDNVHFQNSVEMADKLIEADKYFDMLFYPNRSHGISGGNYSYHMYNSMTNFIFKNL